MKAHEIVETLLEDYDPSELARGQKVEMEHTDDPKVAARIAKDHLRENPRYYSILARTPLGHDA